MQITIRIVACFGMFVLFVVLSFYIMNLAVVLLGFGGLHEF